MSKVSLAVVNGHSTLTRGERAVIPAHLLCGIAGPKDAGFRQQPQWLCHSPKATGAPRSGRQYYAVGEVSRKSARLTI